MISKALVVDDDEMDRELIYEGLCCIDEAIDVQTARDGQEACERATEEDFDVVFADLCMPQKDGIEVLESVSETSPLTEIVMITGHSRVATVVEAMKKGCFDYLTKPVSVEEVEAVLTRLNRHRHLIEQNNFFRSELGKKCENVQLIGKSPEFDAVCRDAVRVAPTDATVLIQGESGTGKELLARLIHAQSERDENAYICVNCAALADSLLESELFGHVKGAFTGANKSKPGRFELADEGTLLLDEVTETSEKLQAELLRVIETNRFERVGGTETIDVDVRILATTNRDVEKEVAEGNFREDLYYRLNVVPIELPPLRDRSGDVRVLARFFARRVSKKLKQRCPDFTERALCALEQYSWPGNVRELENMIRRVLIMTPDSQISVEDLPDRVRDGGASSTGSEKWREAETLEEIEREAILETIREADGNKTRAADKLGISPRTVWNKLNKYEDQGVLPDDMLGSGGN